MLAGGTGSRLHPVTRRTSKQLLPVDDKPMTYYPLSVHMLAGIHDVLVITTPEDWDTFERLLGDGSQWGLQIGYATQDSPDGLAHAFLIGADFLDGHGASLVLGDNLFYGSGLSKLAAGAAARRSGATVFGHHVEDPERYGIVDLDANGCPTKIEEKPTNPTSHWAVTRALLLRRASRRGGRSRQAVGARRTRDHLGASRLLPRAGRTGRGATQPRLRRRHAPRRRSVHGEEHLRPVSAEPARRRATMTERMKFLVTGGKGFIGSAVVRHPINHTDHDVVNVDKMTYAATDSPAAFIQTNLVGSSGHATRAALPAGSPCTGQAQKRDPRVDPGRRG